MVSSAFSQMVTNMRTAARTGIETRKPTMQQAMNARAISEAQEASKETALCGLAIRAL
jgi:hypothetical protein